MWARDVVETVKWIAPGSDVVELHPVPIGRPRVGTPTKFHDYKRRVAAKVERLTDTQIVLDNGARYRLESYDYEQVGGTMYGYFDCPAPNYPGRSLLVHPDDPRAKKGMP